MFRGSNLNSSWGKCDIWLVDQWITLSTCLCMIGCWLHVESFDIFICDACLVIIVHWRCWHVDYIDWFSYLLLVVWLSCFPGHVYSHFCISRSSWHDWFYLLYSILFVSTYCPFCYIPILFILSLPNLCVDMSDIPVLCMIALLLCDACIVCLCGSHFYPLTSNPLVSVISFISILTFASVRPCVYLFL